MTPRRRTAISPARRTRRSPEEARREILQSAEAYLQERPFRTMTVARLMERTAVGRSAFYAYFRDLYQVAEALMREVEQELTLAARPWFDDSNDPAAAVLPAITGVVEVWVRRGPMLRGISDAARHDAGLERVWHEVVGRLDAAIAAGIRRDQARGLIGPIDAEETAAMLNRLDIAYLEDRFGRPSDIEPERLINVLVRVWRATLYG
jgi:AcrR family transcriptional regulator